MNDNEDFSDSSDGSSMYDDPDEDFKVVDLVDDEDMSAEDEDGSNADEATCSGLFFRRERERVRAIDVQMENFNEQVILFS